VEKEKAGFVRERILRQQRQGHIIVTYMIQHFLEGISRLSGKVFN
jgi:hypothetical protein